MTDNINDVVGHTYDPRPIGIFDSGIGGLTVLKKLLKFFPHESFIYLGDTARLPYGSKSPKTINKYCEQNIKYLIEQNVKAIILACNSASSFCSQKRIDDIPIYNVIEPGAYEAYKHSKNRIIAVLGTRATVKGKAYMRAIHKLNPDISVLQKSCPLFVPLAEEGLINDPITKLVVNRYLDEIISKNKNLDIIILGCTHYPILKTDIQKAVGPNIKLIESGDSLAQKLQEDLANKTITSNRPIKEREINIRVTDYTENIKEMAGKILHPEKINTICAVDLRK